jgi:hypothetical protein
MSTTLSPEAQERVAAALVEEYTRLGVPLAAARLVVAAGDWDDHPAAAEPEEED